MICPVCKEDVIQIRSRVVEGELVSGCADCYEDVVREMAQRRYRQPNAWFTDESGQEFGVDKNGVIPHEEDPYHNDHFGWEFTGKKKKGKFRRRMFK